MISKVVVKNLMSWKGTHEVDYPEGMVLFDGPYGAGKSSLLTDSLDLVFSGGARSKLQNLVTRGQKEMEVTVYMDIHGKKYKFYFFYRLKSEEITDKGKKRKTGAKTIWESYAEDNGEYKKINLTPESVLGVNYDQVAKKTFLIGQFDLDIFSKAGPSEKYDIIAEAFQIAKLFKIGDSAGDKTKQLKEKKIQIEESLDGIDTAEFEKKEMLEKELKNITKKIEENNKEIQDERKDKENAVLLRREKEYADSIDVKIEAYEKAISSVEASAYKEELKQIENIKKRIDSEKNPELEKKENLLGAVKAELGHLSEQKKTKEEGINNKYIYILNGIDEAIKKIIKRLQSSHVYNNETEKSISENIEFYKALNSEKLSESIKKNKKTLNEKEIETQGFVNEVKRIEGIIKTIESLSGEGDCPTCKRPFSVEEGKSVTDSLGKEIKQTKKKLEKLEKEKAEISEKIKKDDNELVWKGYFDEYVEVQKTKAEGKKLQGEARVEKEKQANELKGLEGFDTKIIEKTKQRDQLEGEIVILKEASKVKDLKTELDTLVHKQWDVGGTIYKVDQLEGVISSYRSTLEDLKKQVIEYTKKLENYKEDTIEKLEESLIKKEEAIGIERETQTELNNRVNRINENEAYYKKIKKDIANINESLSIYEKIQGIFGKKGQPRTLLQNYIIPQLENNVNDILEEIAEGMYRVEFKLTAQTASGVESKNNTFDIIVYQQGTDQSYDTLSGGERTNINYSIRLGITETLNDILGQKVSDFLVLDETFRGDLDASNGGEALANSVIKTMSSGRFKQIFIITHTDYIKDKLEDMSSVIKIEKRAKYSRLAI